MPEIRLPRAVQQVSQRVVDLFGHPGGLATEPMAHVLNFFNGPGNRNVAAALDLGSADHVLEIGFGGGAAIRPTLEQLGPTGRLIGFDLSADMAVRANRAYAEMVDRHALQLGCADVAYLPLRDACVDAAYAMHSHLYWPSPLAGLRELHRVVRLGGRVLLGMDTVSGIRLIRLLGPAYRPAPPAELEPLFRQAGFGEVRTTALTRTTSAVIGRVV